MYFFKKEKKKKKHLVKMHYWLPFQNLALIYEFNFLEH